MSYPVLSCFFFFFQAEDGIRDADVTGVQTCALPICDLSVRQTEQLARSVARPAGSPAPRAAKDADTRALESDLTANLRLKVTIDHKAGGQAGELRIAYGSLEELDGLCQILSS